MESEEKEGIETCPTCGSHVPTYISSGGTGSFIPIFIEVIRDRLVALESSLKEKQSRISSLEAALSLSPENVERVTTEIYESETGCLWQYADEREKKNWQSYAVRTLITIRRLAGASDEQ